LDDRTRLEVLWPPGERKDLADPDHANDSSLVLRITCDGRSVLLPGDATKLAQGELLGQGVDLRADVLVMPHHGGWNPSLPAFFQAVSPKVAIVSNNIDPHAPAAGGLKAQQFYQRLRTACRFHSTPRDGWICVRFGEGRIDVQTMR
jgi:beta-lactamase superfamily II metal-dependent hydrolase